MRKVSEITIGVIGAILAILTLSGFFLLKIERSALYFWALDFLLFAEVVFSVGLIIARRLGNQHNRVLARTGLTVMLSIYLSVTAISILFTGRYADKLYTFIFLELVIIFVFAIAVLSLLAFAAKAVDADRRTVSDRRFIESCERRIGAALSDSRNHRYAVSLNTLYESLKYSDKIGTSSVDNKISARIDVLENVLGKNDISNHEAEQLITELIDYVNQRKLEIRELKRGGF